MADVALAQINMVVPDVPLVVRFLEALGAEFGSTWPAWMAHHRTMVSAAPGLDVDVDSAAFAAHWGGLPPQWSGVVLVLRVPDRPGVDALYRRAIEAGATARRAPYDAFWGARLAVVEGPGGLVFGVMSPVEEQSKTAPPDPATFANAE